MADFRPERCDLCGSSAFQVLCEGPGEYSMTSDSRIVKLPLTKLECLGCGLIRDGNHRSADGLINRYEEDYDLNAHSSAEEHCFLIDESWVKRSSYLADWITSSLQELGCTRFHSSVEVGAGQGLLLEQLNRRVSSECFKGIELNRAAVELGQRRGLRLIQGGLEALEGKHDLLVSFGVIEHVVSPSAFLETLARSLDQSGLIVLGQPTADVESYDLFFSDHLHHFGAAHIERLANAAGLRTVNFSVSRVLGNFSLHILARCATLAVDPQQRDGLPAMHETADRYKHAFAEIRRIADHKSRGVAIYGTGELALLLSCYGGLKRSDIEVAIDDNPRSWGKRFLGARIVSFDEFNAEQELRELLVILAVPKQHGATLALRLRKLGIDVANPLA